MASRGHLRALFGPGWDSRQRSLDLNPDDVYLINPGAAGQPRDGDPRAAYLIYHSDGRCVDYFREEYDVAATQEKIRRAGLPDVLADRLAVGQ